MLDTTISADEVFGLGCGPNVWNVTSSKDVRGTSTLWSLYRMSVRVYHQS